jgi:hypothetical protein
VKVSLHYPKGMKVVLVGDVEGYVPGHFKPGEAVIITGFRESFKGGSSDHIIEVSNGTMITWVKPSNIKQSLS